MKKILEPYKGKFVQYKRIVNAYEGAVLTGKPLGFGGSLARKEATGYGVMYFASEMLKEKNDSSAKFIVEAK